MNCSSRDRSFEIARSLGESDGRFVTASSNRRRMGISENLSQGWEIRSLAVDRGRSIEEGDYRESVDFGICFCLDTEKIVENERRIFPRKIKDNSHMGTLQVGFRWGTTVYGPESSRKFWILICSFFQNSLLIFFFYRFGEKNAFILWAKMQIFLKN